MDVTPLQTRIAGLLAEQGWQVAAVEPEPPDWWADEQWRLESLWRPVGFALTLTFLVDPQWDGPRRKGEGLWAVGASLRVPETWQDAGQAACLFLGRGIDRRLDAFLRALSDLRGQALPRS